MRYLKLWFREFSSERPDGNAALAARGERHLFAIGIPALERFVPGLTTGWSLAPEADEVARTCPAAESPATP